MLEAKSTVLFLNGVRDTGTVDVLRATPLGKLVISTSGSCHVASFLPADRVNVVHFTLDQHASQEVDLAHFQKYDAVFCEISDPDSHTVALSKARKLFKLTSTRIRWINDPHGVQNTRREIVPQLLAGIGDVYTPKTILVNDVSIKNLRSAIEAGELRLPVLIRPTGSHGGKHLVKIEHFAELNDLDLSRYPRAFVTEFLDTAIDGLYAKYRYAVVAGEPFLRHVIFSNHWCVHSESRSFMADHPDLQEREARILQEFDRDLKVSTRDAIKQIHSKIGLDYFGIDFTISGGRLIIFEVNANMNILNNNQPAPNIWDKPIDDIRQSILHRLIMVAQQPA